MIITRKALPRRTFLRGVGASLALPLLDAMIPSMTALAKTPANPVRRLGFIYMPMGCDITRWTPPRDGTLSELSPALQSLAPFVDQLTVITNLELKNAYPGTHATSNAAFLSAATAKWTESTDYYLGTTVDQVAAQQIGRETLLPSLELAMDLLQTVGQCDNGYACVYQNNLSWSSPTTPLPAEAHPRIVFERLFGEGGSTADRRAALRRRASLLDWVRDDISRLQNRLGPEDRTRVGQYLDTVREVDREHGLPPRHDGGPGGGAAYWSADRAAVARVVDGFDPDGGPVRQRLRLRLSEQPLLVVAHDAAAGRGASANRV